MPKLALRTSVMKSPPLCISLTVADLTDFLFFGNNFVYSQIRTVEDLNIIFSDSTEM